MSGYSEENISEIECVKMQEEEVTLLDEKEEAKDKYCKEEVTIIQESKKRLHTCGITFLILLVIYVAPLIYTSA